jgi:uncharacterized membrane protein YphA (DoxX/SURF4 family)
MLNLFPIQFLALFAYLILRVITGFVLIHLSFKHFAHRQELAEILKLPLFPFGKISTILLISTEIFIGITLTLGLFTQAGAILLMLLSLKMLVLQRHFKHHTLPSPLIYTLLFAIGLSLFITGAGALAFDLPI